MIKIIKCVTFIFAFLATAPFWVLFRMTKSRSLFVGQAQFFALVPGLIGSYLRIAYYRMTLESCSLKGFIGFGSFFAHPEVELGKGYFIGAYCNIGMCQIGDHATIATGVYILSGKKQHGFRQMGVPIQEQPGQFKKVSIGSNSWIGNGAIVMANVGIQNVIAAGCVIAAPTGDYEVWGGNPGVLIKRIDDF